LLKLYRQFDAVKILTKKFKDLTDDKKAIDSAFKQKLIDKITKKQYKQNVLAISEIDKEISDIKVNLAKYAVNISEIVNREVAELKSKKDSLLRERAKVDAQLHRIRSDLSHNKHVSSKTFSSLVKFFPEIDQERVSEVEEFHSKMARILKKELLDSERTLAEMLDQIDADIFEIDKDLSHTFSSIDKPEVIVDRVHELASRRSSAEASIRYFDVHDQVNDDLGEARKELNETKLASLKFVQNIVNDKIRKLVNQVYDIQRRSPVLELVQKNYNFSAVEDTGTGKAYSNLVLFDIAVFSTTDLPFIIHDSVLFKNIQTDAVARIIELYGKESRQSFISIDEVEKYGVEASSILNSSKFLELADDKVLYKKDWRVKEPS